MGEQDVYEHEALKSCFNSGLMCQMAANKNLRKVLDSTFNDTKTKNKDRKI